MDFGKRLAEVLTSKNITPYKISKLTGITQSTISDLLNGKIKTTTLDSLTKISSALNITVSELIGEIEPTLTPELKDLLSSAKGLSSEQLRILTDFLKTIR